VRLYHLLWELTHVCFEHPGLLDEPAPIAEGSCITCSDEGRVAEVQVPPASPGAGALVRAGLGTEWVDVTLVGDVVPGDLLLVHAGFALTRLDSDGGS
jgi:hydrogenase maturation factor